MKMINAEAMMSKYDVKTFRLFNYKNIPILRAAIPDLGYRQIPIVYLNQIKGRFIRWQYNKNFRAFGFLVFGKKMFLAKAIIDAKIYEYFISENKPMTFDTWLSAIRRIPRIDIRNFFGEWGEILVGTNIVALKNVEKYFLYQTSESLFFRVYERNIPLLDDIFIEEQYKNAIDVLRLPIREQLTVKKERKRLDILPKKRKDSK